MLLFIKTDSIKPVFSRYNKIAFLRNWASNCTKTWRYDYPLHIKRFIDDVYLQENGGCFI